MTETQPEGQMSRISRLLMTDAVDALDHDISDAGRGQFEVDHALFATREAAQRYCVNRAVLDEHLRELTLVEERTERMLAARDAMRAQVPEMVAALSREQIGAAAGEHEHELALSTLAVEQRRHRRSIEQGLDLAHARAHDYPAAVDAWNLGQIHSGHMRVIEVEGEHLAPEQRGAYEAEVLAQASGKTPAQLRHFARRIANRLGSAPDPAVAETALEDRAVWVEQQPGGMAHFTIKTTAVLAEAAFDRLRQAAKRAPADDPRRMQQHMSDTAITALVSGTCDAGLFDGIIAKVTLTMPAVLVARGTSGDSNDSGRAELPSGQLIDDRSALMLAGGASSWTRLFTHPATGVVVTADVYEPSASLRRLIIARDRSCRFPGCNQPAHRCDIDHTEAWNDGGRTLPANLAVLCRHHHTLKHRLGPEHGWQVQQLSPGVLEWTAPDGRRHLVEPEPAPTAIPPPEPAPPPDDGEPPPF